jgi:hypothetical protein
MRYVIISLIIILYIALTIKAINDIRVYKKIKIMFPRDTSNDIGNYAIVWIFISCLVITITIAYFSIKYW